MHSPTHDSSSPATALFVEWCRSRKSSWIAAQLGVSPSTISAWRYGRQRPQTPEMMAAIERLSEGAVPASSWVRR